MALDSNVDLTGLANVARETSGERDMRLARAPVVGLSASTASFIPGPQPAALPKGPEDFPAKDRVGHSVA